MISGIGTDIVAIERFQRFVDTNSAVLVRIFTESERTLCSARKDSASCFAARFAAKEAFLKALGTGLRDGISWQDLEITLNELGKPELLISGQAREIFTKQGLKNTFVSLSHDGGNAIAMVVLENV
jgi:holo-[acyl-carrier protein] synthase